MAALVASTATTAAACGSSSSAAVGGTKLQQDCTTVANVLANGPDPDADSVGYAQAQILPLRQLQVSDKALKAAVANLASAYQAFSSGNGSAHAAVAVGQAQHAVNAICPGAAQ